jgi:small-conductance mechanosensitive channel
VELLDSIVFAVAIFLVVVGLIFEASGFGTFVAGQLGALLLVVIGISMFWAGWSISGARSFSCAIASALNMFDAASTLAFWNFEINPAVRSIGPTLFLVSKICCSIVIVLYAKFHQTPKKGGIALSLLLAAIVGWNLSQQTLAYLGLSSVSLGLLLGALLSFVAALVVVLMLFLGEKSH